MTDEIHYGEAAVRESCINSSIAYKEVKCIIGVLLILLQNTTLVSGPLIFVVSLILIL